MGQFWKAIGRMEGIPVQEGTERGAIMMINRKATVKLIFICLILMLFTSQAIADEEIRVTGVGISENELTLNIGQEEELTATVYPLNATDRRVEWHNSDPDLLAITVSDRTVRLLPLSQGKATITVTTVDGGYSAQCLVTIIKPVRSIGVDPEEITLAPGETLELEGWVLPRDATEQGIIWESANPGVASVDEKGNVKAKNPGEARIIARSLENDRISVYSVVTVSDDVNDVVAPVTEDPVVEAPQAEEPPAVAGNNLWTYIIIGVGAVVILGGAFFMVMQSKQKSRPERVIPPVSSAKEQIYRPLIVGLTGIYAGQKIDFINNQVTIGRDPNVAQVAYPQANTEISRKHCIIYYDQVSQQFILEDTSSNGTFLANGEKLERNQRHNLQPGESFSLTESGETFTVELE